MCQERVVPGACHWCRWLAFSLAGALLATGLVVCALSSKAAITVEWTTESEVNTAGFHLYRSESPDGPFERVTQELIPASPDPILGGHYVYTDTDVLPGQVYYYQLEDVEFDGTSTRHGPIEAKVGASDGLRWLVSALLIFAGLSGMWWVRWRTTAPASSAGGGMAQSR